MTRELYELARVLRDLAPGNRLEICATILGQQKVLPGWNPAEYLMEMVVGSSYNLTFFYNLELDAYVYTKLREDLPYPLRTYVSPDRQQGWRRRPDGYWEPTHLPEITEQPQP